MKKILFFSLMLLFACYSGFAKKPKPAVTNSMVINFHHLVGKENLRLNDSINRYANANGDDFYVTTFKYYVSNIQLEKANGEIVSLPDTYLLVNAADPSSYTQSLTGIPDGKYKSISFLIGVDSLRNFEGAQTGSLDPAKGMFWSWKTGYIFVKMEGVSTKSGSKRHALAFHIGGAIAPNNTIRTFSQDLPKKMKLKSGRRCEMDINVDVASMFAGQTTVKFEELYSTMGGPRSVLVADNYSNGMFTVTKVKRLP